MSLHRKLNVKIFLMFIVAENTGSINICTYTFHFKLACCAHIMIFFQRKSDSMLIRIKDAENAQMIAELKQKIAELEIQVLEMSKFSLWGNFHVLLGRRGGGEVATVY